MRVAKILFITLSLYGSLLASNFGVLFTNPMIYNLQLTDYQTNNINEIHRSLLRMVKNQMRKKFDDDLDIKYINSNIPEDILIEKILAETIDIIQKYRTRKRVANINMNQSFASLGDFKKINSKNNEFSSAGAMATAILKIKEACRKCEITDPFIVTSIFNQNNKKVDEVEIDAIFSLSYKYDYIEEQDKEYLIIYIFYSPTEIADGTVMVQVANQSIDISTYNQASNIAGNIYKLIVNKISNIKP